jgi:hypothetical protein
MTLVMTISSLPEKKWVRRKLKITARPFLSWNESGRLERQAGISLPNTGWQSDAKVLFIAQAGAVYCSIPSSSASAVQQRAQAVIGSG